MADCPECGSKNVELVDTCPICELPGCTKCTHQRGVCPECLRLPLVDSLHEAFRLENLPTTPKKGDVVSLSEALSAVSNPIPKLSTGPTDWNELRLVLEGEHMRNCMAKYDHAKLVESLTDLKNLYYWAITPKKEE